MTTATSPVGEYVTRAQPVARVGTFTGVPVTTHGTYTSGIDTSARAGRYVQSSPWRGHGRAATASARAGSILARH